MRKFMAIIRKEALLLLRDRAGLCLLFLMPLALVIVITLVQDGAMKSIGAGGLSVAIVDNDGGAMGGKLTEKLKASGFCALAAGTYDEHAAQEAVEKGRLQACVILPKGLSGNCLAKAAAAAARLIPATNANTTGAGGSAIVAEHIRICFDPAVTRGYKASLLNGLRGMVLALETELVMSEFFKKTLPDTIEKRMRAELGEYFKSEYVPMFSPGTNAWEKPGVIAVTEAVSDRGSMPTSVQQNVPAWTLFAMFFIVVPLSTALIREKTDGTLTRVLAARAGVLSVVLGKIAVYMVVCMLQFGLLLLIGIHLLPLLGTPVLEIGPAFGPILLVAFCAGLAATGFGMMVGALSGTTEQAGASGAVTVVILAALGGIMVPTFLMPEVMRTIGLVSPLRWGLDAFLEVFVRRGGFHDVLANALLLLAFFGATVAIACLRLFRSAK